MSSATSGPVVDTSFIVAAVSGLVFIAVVIVGYYIFSTRVKSLDTSLPLYDEKPYMESSPPSSQLRSFFTWITRKVRQTFAPAPPQTTKITPFPFAAPRATPQVYKQKLYVPSQSRFSVDSDIYTDSFDFGRRSKQLLRPLLLDINASRRSLSERLRRGSRSRNSYKGSPESPTHTIDRMFSELDQVYGEKGYLKLDMPDPAVVAPRSPWTQLTPVSASSSDAEMLLALPVYAPPSIYLRDETKRSRPRAEKEHAFVVSDDSDGDSIHGR